MSPAALSVRVYSFYLGLFGAAMVILPNTLLGLFGFAETHEIWIRMLGLFTVTAGLYYFIASGKEQTTFYRATVVGRLFFFVMTIVLTIALQQKPILAAIGCADLAGALWTWFALRTSRN